MKKLIFLLVAIIGSTSYANNDLGKLKQQLTALDGQLKKLTVSLSNMDPKKKVTKVADKHYMIGDRNLYIVDTDITQMHDVWVIVNPANKALPKTPGGVAGAIWQAAGADNLNRQIDFIKKSELAATRGILPTGQAIITDSGDMQKPPFWIVHTPGPNCNAGEDINLLSDSYRNSLLKAKEYKSIAFPPISTGIFGCEKLRCAELAIAAIRDTIGETEIQDVYLTMYRDPDYKKEVIRVLDGWTK